MNEYDRFEAEMVEAGWSLEEIEGAWQKALRQEENTSPPSAICHDDTTQLGRKIKPMQLRVIQDSDRLSIGTIEAQVGMRLANGYKVSKVHEKSVVGECNGHTDKFFPPESIFYTEAVRWGFSHPIVDKQVENLAALTRKFRHGEAAHQQYVNYGYAPALSDRIEEAGFNFALLVQKQREVEIAQLGKAGVKIGGKI